MNPVNRAIQSYFGVNFGRSHLIFDAMQLEARNYARTKLPLAKLATLVACTASLVLFATRCTLFTAIVATSVCLLGKDLYKAIDNIQRMAEVGQKIEIRFVTRGAPLLNAFYNIYLKLNN